MPEEKQKQTIDLTLRKLQDKENGNHVLCWLDRLFDRFLSEWRSCELITTRPRYKKARRVLWLSGAIVFDTWEKLHCFRSKIVSSAFQDLTDGFEGVEGQKWRLERDISILQRERSISNVLRDLDVGLLYACSISA